ncbi:MAG: hypothetical protein AAF909_04880 [Pseudomonadota bacterium]
MAIAEADPHTPHRAEARQRPTTPHPPEELDLAERHREQDFYLFKRVAKSFFSAPPRDHAHARMSARAGFGLTIGAETILRAQPQNAGALRLAAGAEQRFSPADLIPKEARSVTAHYGEHRLAGHPGLAQPRMAEHWAEMTETGAALFYAQREDGVVTVQLYPATTPTVKAEEDALELRRCADLEGLTGRGALERDWRALRAYAEVTSRDGAPTLAQRARVAWLRFSRATVLSGRRRAPRFVSALETAAPILALGAAAMVFGVL